MFAWVADAELCSVLGGVLEGDTLTADQANKAVDTILFESNQIIEKHPRLSELYSEDMW